jgi:MFS family permease
MASSVGETISSVRRWSIVGLLCVGMMVAYFDRVNLSIALAVPEFKQLFNVTDRDSGALNAAFYWSYAFLQIPAGWITDRYGAKYPQAVGFALWSVVSALAGFAGSFWQLFGLRMLLGVFQSIVTPAGMRWIRFHCAENHRGLAVGLFMAASKAGPALGAPLAAWLLLAFGWRLMFVILGLGCLVWLVPWLAMVNEGERALERATTRRHSEELSFRSIVTSPMIWGIVVGTFAYNYFAYFCMTWMPTYFVERRHLSLQSMGFYTMAGFLGMAIVATAAGWAADRMIEAGGDPVSVRKAFSILGLLVASTEVIGALSVSHGVALFFAVFSLCGLGLMTANYWALTQTLIPGMAVGRMVGIQNCAANLPGIVAPLLTGWLKQSTGSYDAPIQAIWFLLIAGVASYVLLVRPQYAPKAGSTQPPSAAR